MHVLEYEAPDGSLIKNPSVELLRNIVETAEPAYWQRGGNGEAILRFVGSQDMLLLKQPPGTGMYLCTLTTTPDCIVPHTGGSFDDFVWEERGGDPFKVPRACLINREMAARVVQHFAEHQGALPELTWIAWGDLPDSYQIT